MVTTAGVAQEGGISRTALTTTSQSSGTFAPGAVSVDAIALKLSDRAAGAATNTLTIVLYDATSSSAVATVNVPVADLPVCSNNNGYRGGWMLFSLGGTFALEAGKNYSIRLNLDSTSTAVAFVSGGTTANWAHFERTTTAAAPAAGDDMFVLGLWTASNTWTQFTVTQDQTTSGTVYGANSVAGTAEERQNGLWVGKSTVTFPVASNTLIAIAGRLNVGPSGVVNIGTSASPVQRGFSAIVQFNTQAGHGITVHDGGTYTMVGESPTSGKNVNWTILSADASSGSTASITVDHDTGWTSGSVVYISTSRPGTGADAAPYTLSADASATTMSFTTGLVASYEGNDGNFPCPAHIILMSYGPVVQSDSAARVNDHKLYASATIYLEWSKVRYCEWESIACTGVYTASHFCIDNTASGGPGVHFDFGGLITGTISVSDVVSVHAASGYHMRVAPGNGSVCTSASFDSIICISDASGASGASITWATYAAMRRIRIFGGAPAFTNNNIVSGTVSYPTDMFSGSWAFGTANGSYQTTLSDGVADLTLSNIVSVAGQNFVMGFPGAAARITFKQGVFLANSQAILDGTSAILTDIVFDRCVIGGLRSASQTMPWVMYLSGSSTLPHHIKFLGCVYSNSYCAPPTSFANLDAVGNFATPCDVRIVNVGGNANFTTGVRHASGAFFTKDSFVSFHKWNEGSGDHRVFKLFPTSGATATVPRPSMICTNLTTGYTAAPCEEMIPVTTGSKLESSVKRFAVTSGSTASVGVYVQKVGTYNGAQPRLVIKRNDSAGYTADTVAATMSTGTGAWESLTTTIAAATDDVVLEVVVDCDGTTGSVYVDDWSAT